MLWVHVPRGTALDRIPVTSNEEVPETCVWFDLVNPNLQEDKIVEHKVGVAVPTREEMQEIEVTSRLYVENGARYMTATLMCQSDTEAPKTTPVTFILSGHRLITVRYDEPRPFMIVGNKLARVCSPTVTGESVMMDLLDAVIDRAADILERIGSEVDQISHDIFEPEAGGADRSRSYNEILKTIGKKGDLASKARESRVLSCAECSATSTRCPITLPISRTRFSSCSTPCSGWSPSNRTTSSRFFRSRPWR